MIYLALLMSLLVIAPMIAMSYLTQAPTKKLKKKKNRQ